MVTGGPTRALGHRLGFYGFGGVLLAPAAVRQVPTIPAEVVRFDAAVAAIMRRDGCTKLVALEATRREHPDLFAAYQAAAATRSPEELRPTGAVVT